MTRGARQNPAATRGRPIIAIAFVLGIWFALRLLFWQSPIGTFAEAAEDELAAPATLSVPILSEAVKSPQADPAAAAGQAPPLPSAPSAPEAEWTPQAEEPLLQRPLPEAPLPQAPLPEARLSLQPLASEPGPEEAPAMAGREVAALEPVSPRRIVGHNMLLAAGLSQMPMSPLIEPYVTGMGPVDTNRGLQPQPIFAPAATQRFEEESQQQAGTAESRWSGGLWTLWREDSSLSSLSPGTPSYGRSQIGAALRYALAPGDARAPQAYLRVSSALEGPRENELALGLSARPVPRIPVRIAAEGRLSERRGGTQLRPAAYAVSEFPPLDLPGGMTGEAYVQAGYVGGDDATAFVDGQARITRRLASVKDFDLAAGGGAWGGAQEGASRLDVGPSASVSFRLGDSAYGRVSADYRVRVAGDAAPASGPALTLSVGF